MSAPSVNDWFCGVAVDDAAAAFAAAVAVDVNADVVVGDVVVVVDIKSDVDIVAADLLVSLGAFTCC